MESSFPSAHFCPTYGEITLQCQNFTFMNGSDDGEVRGQSCEIWYACHLLSIILYSIYWHSSVICVLCTDCILVLTVAYLSSLHVLPFVGGYIHSISCVHSADCFTYLVFLVALTGYLLTCVSFLSLHLAHLLVLLSWIEVQQPVSENGSFTGVSYKEGNKCTEMHIKVQQGEKQWIIW
jgi:hypothetical protein